MTEIKHVSFDVWGTLIRANPEFAENRTRLLSEMFHLDPATVKQAYTETKRFVDNAAEEQGVAYSTDQVFAMLFDRLSLEVPVSSESQQRVRVHVEYLFRRFPPSIDPSVQTLLDWLARRDVTMSIGSNSNFISGNVMWPFLQSNLDFAFEYGVFSDLDMVAKPIPGFFNIIYERVGRYMDRDNILHVGDNSICDGVGASNSGMQFAVIDNPSQLFAAVRSRFL